MLISTGFPGKFLVLYVHQPSLIAIVCKGKTIQTTWTAFTERLPRFLRRHNFPDNFITYETTLLNEYVVSTTDSRTMLAHMNNIAPNIEHLCTRAADYKTIDLTFMEDLFMQFPHGGAYSTKSLYTDPKTWWEMYFQAHQ
jgi:hypothetical protein